MIYPQYLEKEVMEFCRIGNIPVINGIIPSQYSAEVSKFIELKMRMDRAKTREKEELNKYAINPVLQMMIANAVESPIEEYMYNAFIEHDLHKHCRPQFEIGAKRVDFAFPIAKLVVECDGKEWHHKNKEQVDRDQKRDVYLAKKGWHVLHFEGLAIRRNIGICIEKIKEDLQPFLKLAKG